MRGAIQGFLIAISRVPVRDSAGKQASPGRLLCVCRALIRLARRLGARWITGPVHRRHIFTVAVMLLASGCSTLPVPKRVVTDMASHDYVLAGSGGPAVVLEAGLGDGKDAWAPVFSRLSEATSVLAYDRAGYSGSRSREPVRDGAAIVRELRATLDRLGLQPPYVLVGHSIGGMYMELYARTYPDEVAGLVFVDARHAEFTGRCLAQGARWCEPPTLLEAMLPPVARRELAGETATRKEILRAGPVPDVPVVVLTGMHKPLEGERFRAVWLATQRDLASVTAAARHEICDRCGHYIHRDDPDRVVNAILWVVGEVRRRTSGATP